MIYGDGKSPKKCIKNTVTALACPLSSVGTEFITAMPTGPLLLNIPYKNIKKTPKLIPIKKLS